VSLAALVLVLVALQRVGELALARRNTGRLMARGATEVGAGHYPLLVAVHAAWLITLWVFGRDHPVNLFALTGFIVLQGLRLWIIVTLGPRWTTRIMVIPGEPLISSGPYKYLSHPNYAVVAAEIAVLPLAFHLPLVALVFTLVNAAVLGIRIRAEAGALSAIAGLSARVVP
jgi:methyltransferase